MSCGSLHTMRKNKINRCIPPFRPRDLHRIQMQCKRIPALHISMESRSSLSQFSPRKVPGADREDLVQVRISRFRALSSEWQLHSCSLVHTCIYAQECVWTFTTRELIQIYVRTDYVCRGSTNYRCTLLAASPLPVTQVVWPIECLQLALPKLQLGIDGEQSCSDSRQAACFLDILEWIVQTRAAFSRRVKCYETWWISTFNNSPNGRRPCRM